jgi:hypothetical protein
MVTQGAKHGGLALEEVVRFPVRATPAVEYLERNRSTVGAVSGQKRPTERSLSELAYELVTAGDDLAGAIGTIGQETHSATIRVPAGWSNVSTAGSNFSDMVAETAAELVR